MAVKYDLTGQKFERLLVLSSAGKNKHGASLWLCRCECGIEKVVCSNELKSGKTKSCGCHRAEQFQQGRAKLIRQQTKHGQSKNREHHIWQNILYRCQKRTSRQYPDYGGRGISVCDRWQGEEGFANFFADMGPCPTPEHTIDRINNDGNYSPENCRWATRKTQSRNTRSNRIIDYKGEKKTMIEWCEIKGICKHTVWSRLDAGWSIEAALDTPADVSKRRKNKADTLIA